MITAPAGLRPPDVFVVPLSSHALPEAVLEIVEHLFLAGKVPVIGPVVGAVLEREAKGSTAFAEGIAAPHARLDSLEGVAFGLGMAPGGLSDEAADGSRVRIVMLTVAGRADTAPYLALLAGIGRAASSRQFLDGLLASRSPDDAAACFSGAVGRYRNGFASLCAPLVPSPVYVLG